MEFYTAIITGNKEGIYIDPRTGSGYIDKETCKNKQQVNFDGVNHLVIFRTQERENIIIQASGFTPERGIFIDLY